jgi:hypothetical protein
VTAPRLCRRSSWWVENSTTGIAALPAALRLFRNSLEYRKAPAANIAIPARDGRLPPTRRCLDRSPPATRSYGRSRPNMDIAPCIARSQKRTFGTSCLRAFAVICTVHAVCAGLSIPPFVTMDLRLRLSKLPAQTRFSHYYRRCDHLGACWPNLLLRPNRPPGRSRLVAGRP